jgi:hypothetical protein
MPFPPEPEPRVSLVTRVGTLLGAGALVSLAASVPAATRIAREADGRFGVTGVWLALAATLLVPMTVGVGVLRGARRGVAAFGGEGGTARALGFLVWVLATTLALLFFGAALRATTHHHALAGATFAFVGLVLAAGLAAAAARVVGITARWGPLPQRVVLAALALVLFVAFLFFCTKVSHTSPGAGAVALLVDVLACFIAAGLSSGPVLGTARPFAAIGPVAAAVVLVLGISCFRASPKLPAVARARAPLLTWPVVCTDELVRRR